MPVDAENANGSPAASPVPVSNSWPRWSPFIQTYKGEKLLWVTFSSTRDYGLRVRNHVAGMVQCYPSDSLEDPQALARKPVPRQLPAAADLDGGDQPVAPRVQQHRSVVRRLLAAVPADVDAKNNSTHNHTAQWTEQVVTQPPPDMATCIQTGGVCTPGGTPCCSGGCVNNVCGIIP